jgi:DNA-binding MarR family transcriptional regulator
MSTALQKPSAQAIAAATGRLLETMVKHAKAPELGSQQLILLLHLYVNGEVSQGSLTSETHGPLAVNGTTVSKYIRKLGKEGPGWISHEETASNARMKVAYLTPKGRQFVDRAINEVAGYFNFGHT